MRALPAIGFCTSEIENLRPPVRLAPRVPEDYRTSLCDNLTLGCDRWVEKKSWPNALALPEKWTFVLKEKSGRRKMAQIPFSQGGNEFIGVI